MRTMKNLTLAAMAAAALALAGCGGGGGGTSSIAPTTPTTPPTTTPPAAMPVAVMLPSDGNMYLDEMDTMLADQTISLDAGGSMDVGAYTLSCSDAGACEVTITDGEVMATGEVTATYTMAAMATIAEMKMTAMTEMDGRAAGLHEALTRSDGADDIFTGGPAGTSLTITPVQIPQAGWTSGNNTDIVITRGLTGGLSVTRDRAGWHDEAADAASPGAGWAGKVLSSGTQTLTVHSNIANAVRADFEADATTSIYRPGQAAGAILHLLTASTDDNGSGGPGPNGLSLNQVAMQDAYDQGLLDERFFPGQGATGTRTLTYTYSATAAPGPRNYAASFTGTFHGASGTYTCTSDPCTINVTPANLTAPANYAVTSGNTWTFTPDRETTVGNDAQLHRQDSNWLSFGYWINEPASARPGGAYLYNAQVFYGGADQYAFASIANLPRLNLSYTGPAAGLYARMANAATGVESAQGEFSADATLNARYGRGTAGSATADVSGTINNFRNGDGVDMSGWTLSLQRTAAATQNNGAGTGATGGSVLSGDAGNRAGTWEYQLFGPSRAGEYPTGVAGRFFAAIDGNTAVAGSFGAE